MLLFFPQFLSSCGIIKHMKLSKAYDRICTTSRNYTYTVPFELINNYIIVKVAIAEKTYAFLFDTGAALCIDSVLAEQLNKKFITKKALTDAHGEEEALFIYSIPSTGISDIIGFYAPFYSFNFDYANESSGLKVAGVFGASLMKDAIWQIDYKKSTVILDTGSASAISLGAKEFPTLKNDNMPTINYVTTLFGRAIDTVYQTLNTTIKLNDEQTFENMAITAHSALSESLMGNAFMQNYRVTTDWTYRRLYFDRYEKEN
ncbi:MAG: hypothetical protein ACJAT1_000571 [Marivirga sp.]|jgi:hypothetical protein